MRVSLLVTADNCSDEKIKDVIVTINTNGNWTKNTNVDMTYDKVIMGGNPMHYYYGILNKMNFYGYYTNNSHMMNVNKNEMCYVGIRLIFDDGG